MTTNQRNKVAMFTAAKNILSIHHAELSTIPAFEELINEFNNLLSQIESTHQIQQGNTTGTTQLKLKEEAEMIEATVQIAGAMFVYAQINQQPDLQAKCAVSVSQLERMSDEQLKVSCLNVYNEAQKLGNALSHYGKTPEQVAQLKKEIDDFTALIASPRSAVVTRSQATTELKTLVNTANDLLKNKVDKLMELFKTSEAKVYNTYKAARVIVDLRAGKKVVEEE